MSGAITARWTPRQVDLDRFAQLSGDDNPIHVDPAFSARPGARAVSQSLMFPAPAYADEELEIAIEATEGSDAYVIKVARVDDGTEVLAGECTLKERR
jgi:acyl dehydratase